MAGIGTAVGVLTTAIVPRALVAVTVPAVVAAVIGLVLLGWPEAIGGFAGGVAGGVGATPIVTGALRRGGTRAGLGLIVGLAAVGIAALAFVPVVGYLEAIVVPVVGLRVRSQAPERHAGLRTLARD
jgi:hypothetical protein